jgi:hypothetical protein
VVGDCTSASSSSSSSASASSSSIDVRPSTFCVGTYHMPCAFRKPPMMMLHCALSAQQVRTSCMYCCIVVAFCCGEFWVPLVLVIRQLPRLNTVYSMAALLCPSSVQLIPLLPVIAPRTAGSNSPPLATRHTTISPHPHRLLALPAMMHMYTPEIST